MATPGSPSGIEGFVCKDCLPSNRHCQDLLKYRCKDKQKHNFNQTDSKEYVQWNGTMFVSVSRKFVSKSTSHGYQEVKMCPGGDICELEQCTYAHNVSEWKHFNEHIKKQQRTNKTQGNTQIAADPGPSGHYMMNPPQSPIYEYGQDTYASLGGAYCQSPSYQPPFSPMSPPAQQYHAYPTYQYPDPQHLAYNSYQPRPPSHEFSRQPPSQGFPRQPPSHEFQRQPPSQGFLRQPPSHEFQRQPPSQGFPRRQEMPSHPSNASQRYPNQVPGRRNYVVQHRIKGQTFRERVQQEINLSDIQPPLSRENYKTKFHSLICWEEKEHIDILGEKCNGYYDLKVFAYGQEAYRFKRMQRSRTGIQVAMLSGMNEDSIAYATQASEALFIVIDKSKDLEVKCDIIPDDNSLVDDKLYLLINTQKVRKLKDMLPSQCKSYSSQADILLSNVRVEFEVGHRFFDNLVKAVATCDSELVSKIVPTAVDFHPPTNSPMLIGDPVVTSLIHEDEHHEQALQKIADCHNESPPILVNGPFGTGKTRLLALATYFFIQYGKHFQKKTRVLLCAHHQASVDHLLERYFGLLKDRKGQTFKLNLVRLVNEAYQPKNEQYAHYCQTFSDAVPRLKGNTEIDSLVVITTCLSSLRLDELGKGYFTHILLDEGAQAREPEAVAALSLATKKTKIVIAGDSFQVGPSLLVLGPEARENGLKYSLLERLKILYDKLGGVAKQYSISLNVNHRCHEHILTIPKKLFYGDMSSATSSSAPHPSAAHPLIFVCSSLSSSLSSEADELEAELLLSEVVKYASKVAWPAQWGEYVPQNICIATTTHPQLVRTRRSANQKFPYLLKSKMLTTYRIQGQEFQVLFWSTTEPLCEDGSTANPTKSSCDPYVFNTMLTRAKSLVVVVGNPWKLLKIEEHMVRKYGEKAKCWSSYFDLCFSKGSFIIPSEVKSLYPTFKGIKEKLKTEVRDRLGSAVFRQATVADAPKVSVATNQSAQLSDQIKTRGSPEQSRRSKQLGKHSAKGEDRVTPAEHGVKQPLLTPTPSNNSAQKTASKVSTELPSTGRRSHGELPVRDRPPQSPKLIPNTPATNKRSATLVQEPVQKVPKSNQPNKSQDHSVAAQKKRNPQVSQPPSRIETRKSDSTCRKNAKHTMKPSKKNSKSSPPQPNVVDESQFPSLTESSKINTTKRQHKEHINQQRIRNKPVHTLSSTSGYLKDHSEDLDVEIIKETLTRENYRRKFHHLLCWEEKEHSKVLSERCNGLYTVVIYQKGGFESDWIEDTFDYQSSPYERFGYISGCTRNADSAVLADTDSENLSYAKQASEGSCIILDNQTVVHANHIFAHLPKDVDYNAIAIAFTADQTAKLSNWKSFKGYKKFESIEVQFKLKASFFHGLHNNVDNLPDIILQKVLPLSEDFAYSAENSCRESGKPRYDLLTLDKSCQLQALRKILVSDCRFPILIAGPFGTGKTRLLARAAFEILKDPTTRVLICAHHQASADTFIASYFGLMKNPEVGKPWGIKFVRILPKGKYNSKVYDTYRKYFRQIHQVRNSDLQNCPLVITTTGTAPKLARHIRGYFTHILIDEGAQIREPESLGPLQFANHNTKIVFAGDHCQVGPRLVVFGEEPQRYGLGTSIMERLYDQYCSEDGSLRTMRTHHAELSTNYRCHSGILMLPSHLFYDSTLLCRSDAFAHPDAPFPLEFVCSSLKKDYARDGIDKTEIDCLLEQVNKYARHWPSTWGEKDLSQICIMSPSANQVKRIRNRLYYKSNRHLKDVDVLKAYEIQGRQYRAIFIGTAEITNDEGVPLNQTKSLCDRFVFNTALTRSQSLVVVVGNPHFLLDNEVRVGENYRSTGHDMPHCWSHYIQTCFESDSFHLNKQVERDLRTFKAIVSLKSRVSHQCEQSQLESASSTSLALDDDDHEARGDAILHAYQSMYQNFMKVDEVRFKLRPEKNRNVLTWNIDENTDAHPNPLASQQSSDSDNTETYECVLHMDFYNKGKAVPLDPNRDIVKIRGSKNRKGAFDGDTVRISVFDDNPPDTCYGRVTEITKRGEKPDFLCTVTHDNSSCFSPVGKKDPLIYNLPFITKKLLKSKEEADLKEHLQSTKEVVVFDAYSLEECMQGDSVKVIPVVKKVFPISIARNMLFIVRFISWDFKYNYPLGAVIKALPRGNNLNRAENLLKIWYDVEFSTPDQAETIPKSSASGIGKPVDFHAFTIDPETAIVLDDAISFKRVPSEQPNVQSFELGVHIVDVAKHLPRGSDDDKHAMKMATSVYGGKLGKVMHMLPSSIRSQLSLNPGCQKNTLSCVATVSIQGSCVISITKPLIRKSTIESCIQFSYEKAQRIMDEKESSNESIHKLEEASNVTFVETLKLLYCIACHLKRNRLGNDSCYVCGVSEPGDRLCWQTHMLIEELMIWSNSIIAERVHNHYPDRAILRRQGLPNMKEKAAVLAQHRHVMKLSHSLSHMAENAPASIQTLGKEPSSFVLPTSTFDRLVTAVQAGNLSLIVSILTSDRDYPQLAAAEILLQRTSEPAEYCCTEEDKDVTEYKHESLNLPRYTHFTSPLRRYVDIIMQRMLTGILVPAANYDVPREKHASHCQVFNRKVKQAKQFEKKADSVVLSSELMSSSLIYEAFICKKEKRKVELTFPSLDLKMLHSKEKSFDLEHIGSMDGRVDDLFVFRMQLTSFNPQLASVLLHSPEYLKLLPNERLPEGSCPPIQLELFTGTDMNDTLEISKVSAEPSRPSICMPLTDWKKCMEFVKNTCDKNLTELKKIVSSLASSSESENETPPSDPELCPVVNYRLHLSLQPYEVFNVWLTYSTKGAMISPIIQLIEIAPHARVCIQHNSNPAECFSDPILLNASRKRYSNLEEYIRLWEKLLLAEAATQSVKENRMSVIQDVFLKWPNMVVPSNCLENIYYIPEDGQSIKMCIPKHFEENCSEFFDIKVGSLICARYGTKPASTIRSVFHMVVTDIKNREQKDQETEVLMEFIGISNCRISESVKKILHEKCEIQVIALSPSHRRVYQALLNLTRKKSKQESPNQLVHKVALGLSSSRHCKGSVDGAAAENLLRTDSKANQLWQEGKVLRLNNVQLEAIKISSGQPFQLIQGPPGTGKSETGAHLAYLFAKLNREIPGDKCVLYCGPSNKAVDVVLEKLHKLCKPPGQVDLKILRVYGKAVQRKDFPDPGRRGNYFQETRTDFRLEKWAQMYALHHKVRDRNPRICQMEDGFKKLLHNQIPSVLALSEYRQIVKDTEKEVIRQKYDIVLCTCNEAAGWRLTSNVFPRQCIVDESGMAIEPETIAPISLCEHVVLIGDHKQLQPVIDYGKAKLNGLSTSLFERYAEKFQGQFTKTLTIQYRMHEAICEFPSEHFYDGQLQTDTSVKQRQNREANLHGFWPNGPRYPILFCDVVGKEGENLTGSREEKHIGFSSKYNRDEAKKVVEILCTLHHVHKIDLKQLAVLTPYSAQEDQIKRFADKVGVGDVTITTIIKSQGDEYGFVVLSTVRSQPLDEIANPDHVQPDQSWLRENLGFVTDAHQINVGITRSKYGLIIVGNQRLLEYDKQTWEPLINRYDDRSCITPGNSFPDERTVERLRQKVPGLY